MKYWDFAYPTQVTSGAAASTDFIAATGGSVNFGGSAGAYKAHAVSYATWGDAANLNGWSAPQAILLHGSVQCSAPNFCGAFGQETSFALTPAVASFFIAPARSMRSTCSQAKWKISPSSMERR